MVFQNPLFLYGCLFCTVPIVIHLFQFQRSKKVYFTNVGLIAQAKKEHISQNILKKWWLLLLRIGFIIALSFAFAQPIFLKDTNVQNIQQAHKTLHLYVDNSLSMQVKQNNETLLNLAKNTALQIAEQIGKDNATQLISNSTLSTTYVHFVELVKALNHLEYYTGAKTADLILEKYTQRNNSKDHKVFFLLSDFQKNTFQKFDFIQKDSLNKYFLIPFNQPTPNLFLDSVWFKDPFIYPRQINTCFVRLNKTGDEALKQQYVRLFIDNKQIATQQVSLNSKVQQSVIAFNFSVNKRGRFQAKVTTQDPYHIFDNSFFFTFEVAPTIEVVHISKDIRLARPFEKVFATSPIFNFTAMPYDQINYQKLQNADAIILNQVQDLSVSLRKILDNSLEKKSNVFIIPSQDLNIASYQNWIPFRISKNKQMQNKVPLFIPNYPHPFFNGIFEKKPNAQSMPKARAVITWNSNYRRDLLLLEAFKTPFLSRVPKNKGYIFLMASDIQKNSNLEYHALFLPLLYKIATFNHASQSSYASFLGDDVISLYLDSLGRNIFELIYRDTLEKIQFIPDQRFINRRLDLMISDPKLPSGFYGVRHTGKTLILETIGLNYPTTESRTDAYSMEELKEIFSNQNNVRVMNYTEFTNVSPSEDSSLFYTPLWKYFIVLAILSAISESVLVRFMRN